MLQLLVAATIVTALATRLGDRRAYWAMALTGAGVATWQLLR